MLYRFFILLILASGFSAHPVSAQSTFGSGWAKNPSVSIVGRADDPRIPLVRDAIDFWNKTLGELANPFRLGAIIVVTGSVPANDLQQLSRAVVGGGGRPAFPQSAGKFGGDMLVILSDADFVSFAARWPSDNKALVAIKSEKAFPFTLPNVARNVIAHELGHAIGLGHNADPAMLMCGRPADCRPDLFASPEPRYFPLTDNERANLRRMYPLDWRER